MRIIYTCKIFPEFVESIKINLTGGVRVIPLFLNVNKRVLIGLIIVVVIMISKSNVSLAELSLDKTRKLFIRVVIAEQTLYLLENDAVIKRYDISASAYGVGNKAGSNKTPLGMHKVVSKFGKNAELNTIFKSRKNTGRIAEINYDKQKTPGDLITSRILWLAGLEEGVNKGSGIDSYLRHIYIHGTPDEGLIGSPASHGCIRMRNSDVVELFDLVPVGTIVNIQAE